MTTSLIYSFLQLLPQSGLVVDLGAGEGKYAKILAEAGHRVIAVDKKPPQDMPTGVEYETATIQDWEANLPADFRADGYLLKNIVQFLPRDWIAGTLLPFLKDRTSSHGVIAIETFTKAPNPPFDKPHTSYYNLADLMSVFRDWKIELAEEVQEQARDMAGTPRQFHVTRLIAAKP